jgi:hypothetical protein
MTAGTGLAHSSHAHLLQASRYTASFADCTLVASTCGASVAVPQKLIQKLGIPDLQQSWPPRATDVHCCVSYAECVSACCSTGLDNWSTVAASDRLNLATGSWCNATSVLDDLSACARLWVCSRCVQKLHSSFSVQGLECVICVCQPFDCVVQSPAVGV